MNNNDSHSFNMNDIDNNDDSHKLDMWNAYYTYTNEHYNDNHNECDLLSFIPQSNPTH